MLNLNSQCVRLGLNVDIMLDNMLFVDSGLFCENMTMQHGGLHVRGPSVDLQGSS